MSGVVTYNSVAANGVLTTNVSVSENLVVSGKLNANLQGMVDYQNLAWRAQFDLSDIYHNGYIRETADPFTVENIQYLTNTALYNTQKYAADCTYNILDSQGNPTTFLTENTDWTNPFEYDKYGNPALLVKINDNGTLNYINVANTSITEICTQLVPATCNVFKTHMTSWDQYLHDFSTEYTALGNVENNWTTGLFTLADQQDMHAQYLSYFLKRGMPMPDVVDTQGFTDHVFYNQIDQTGFTSYPGYDLPTGAGLENMIVGLDIRPYINGSNTIDFFLSAGINEMATLKLRGLTWTNQVGIPPLSLSVTTDATEYTQKKASNLNSVYLNTTLNILNFNIVDFGDYTVYSPIGNVWATSGDPVLDSSNAIIMTPTTFVASFGMYRNTVVSTSSLSGLRNVPDSNIAYTSTVAGTPITCPLAEVEYLITVSDTTDVTYTISNKVGTQTISFPRIMKNAWWDGRDYSTNFTLQRYSIKSGVNSTVQESVLDLEHVGFPFMNDTSNIGNNRNTPYLKETFGCNGTPQVSSSARDVTVYDLTGTPDNQEALSSTGGTITNGYVRGCRYGAFHHELFHQSMYSIGINSSDYDNAIIDDEMISAYTQCMSWHGNLYKDRDNTENSNVYHSLWIGLHQAEDTFQYVTRGAVCPFVQNYGNSMYLTLSGTNYSPLNTVNDYNFPEGYKLSLIMQPIIESYDPNFQYLKLLLYYYSKKIAVARNFNLLGLYYKNHTNSGLDNFVQKTSNPNIVTHAFKQAIEGAHLHYSNGTLITDAAQLQMEVYIMNHLLRNNDAIPPKYRNNYAYPWYCSSHSPHNVYFPFDEGHNRNWYDTPAYNMAAWDMNQANEDSVETINNGTPYVNSVTPWWPKVISPAGADAHGLTLNPYNPSGLMTQDSSYKAICTSTQPFVSDITRHLWSLGSFSYALTSNITSVTIELEEPVGAPGTYGDYNTNVSVAIFKYIPECCITGTRSDKGVFLMKGPYTLSGTGDSKTIAINGAFVDTPGSSFIVSNTSTHFTAPMANFNYIFPHGIDGTATIYTPPAWALARGASLGMTGNDVYQPVTKLIVLNKQIDSFEFNDSDVAQKLYLEQLKPTSVKVSVTQI